VEQDVVESDRDEQLPQRNKKTKNYDILMKNVFTILREFIVYYCLLIMKNA